jgi:hypothetical protein
MANSTQQVSGDKEIDPDLKRLKRPRLLHKNSAGCVDEHQAQQHAHDTSGADLTFAPVNRPGDWRHISGWHWHSF